MAQDLEVFGASGGTTGCPVISCGQVLFKQDDVVEHWGLKIVSTTTTLSTLSIASFICFEKKNTTTSH
jgi:hypothetical protein